MFAAYLRSKAKLILFFGIILAIYTLTMLLFDVAPIVMLYPLILCVVIGVVALLLGYASFHKRHNQLQRGNRSATAYAGESKGELHTVDLHDISDLPETNDPLEQDYQAIIEKLIEEEKRSRFQAASDYENMMEYYTIWAHQIKTPIASMRLALQEEDSDRARKLRGDLNRIESYVEMVLTFLRLDSKSTDYVIAEYDLDTILRAAIRKFSYEFIGKKLSLDLAKTDLQVLTDEKWLTFVIEQVISNAVKYTSAGGVRVYADGNVLCIADTGIGIAPEDLPRIFENGYTGFNGRQDKRASGIGLYLCKRICDNLGHKIYAESTPGVGTTIKIDLTKYDINVRNE